VKGTKILNSQCRRLFYLFSLFSWPSFDLYGCFGGRGGFGTLGMLRFWEAAIDPDMNGNGLRVLSPREGLPGTLSLALGILSLRTTLFSGLGML